MSLDLNGNEAPSTKPASPKWSTTTKLVVALTLAAVLTALFIQFRNLVGPILLALILAYLAHPIATWINHSTRIPWRMGITVIYMLILFSVLGLLTWGGFAVVEQVQSLIDFIQRAVTFLPDLIQDLAANPRRFGPFVLDLTQMDIQAVSTQVLSYIQPILSRLGTLVGTFASSAVSLLGWLVFTLLVSYFILAETSGSTSQIISLTIPGYDEDMSRISASLGRTWNAFLRGQLLLTTITILLYTILLGVLGVRYYFGLALVAGMARFVPYIGPAVAWTTYGLVSFFQGSTIFGLEPLTYSLVVVGVAWVTDSVFDNMVTPRVMADALAVHPAAVMVAALIAANLFGFIGIVLAAPVLASLRLIIIYMVRKLSDQDPWEGFVEVRPPQPMAPFLAAGRRLALNMKNRIARAIRWLRDEGYLDRTRLIKPRRKNH